MKISLWIKVRAAEDLWVLLNNAGQSRLEPCRKPTVLRLRHPRQLTPFVPRRGHQVIETGGQVSRLGLRRQRFKALTDSGTSGYLVGELGLRRLLRPGVHLIAGSPEP